MMKSIELWRWTRMVNQLNMILSEKRTKNGWHRSDVDLHPEYASETGWNSGLACLHPSLPKSEKFSGINNFKS